MQAVSSFTPTLLRKSCKYTGIQRSGGTTYTPKCLTACKRLYWSDGRCDVSIAASLQDAAGQTSDRSLSGLAMFRD